DRIEHLARCGVRTRDYAFLTRGLPVPAEEFGVKLIAPSGAEWTWGPGDAAQSVSGPALDFCLLVTQRRHRADLSLAASGPDADRWLDIAQAYAGPPGPGRAPGQFAGAGQAWEQRRQRRPTGCLSTSKCAYPQTLPRSRLSS